MPCDAYMGQFLGDIQPRLMSSANGRIIVPSIYHHWHGLPTHMLNWGVKLLLSLIEKVFSLFFLFFFFFSVDPNKIETKLWRGGEEVFSWAPFSAVHGFISSKKILKNCLFYLNQQRKVLPDLWLFCKSPVGLDFNMFFFLYQNKNKGRCFWWGKWELRVSS